jgi:hypothetical protein
MHYLRLNLKSLKIDGKALVIDWAAWPESFTFQAPNLAMQGGYAGEPVVLEKSATPGTYEGELGGWLSLAAVYITDTYGGAEGYALSWVVHLDSGTDNITAFRLLSVTAAAPEISPLGLYCRLPLFSNVTAPPYEVLPGA